MFLKSIKESKRELPREMTGAQRGEVELLQPWDIASGKRKPCLCGLLRWENGLQSESGVCPA